MRVSVRNFGRWSIQTVFLDRDGVINQKMPEGHYVRSWEEFHVLPGVPEAIRNLNHLGLRVLVVSNQRGIARGLYTESDLQSIHTRLHEKLMAHGARIDRIYFCPHESGTCACRKPLPGMFCQAQTDFPDIRPENSLMIGDSLADMEFAQMLGMPAILIEAYELPRSETSCARKVANRRCPSLAAAVKEILSTYEMGHSNKSVSFKLGT